MATAAVTYSFTSGTTAVSAQVNQDFTDLVTFLNTNVVHVDGSKTMTGALTLAASDPASANQAARKSYVDQNARYKGTMSGGTAATLVGTVPASDTQLFFKGASGVTTTDGNAELSCTFATAFPNSVAGLIVTNVNPGDHGAATSIFGYSYTVTAISLTSFTIKVYRGTNQQASSPVQFSWLAWGN